MSATTRVSLSLAAGVLLAASATVPAHADAVSDFYKGRRVSFIIASDAGGGYDTYGRVLMRHYNRHLPGAPNVVVKNMPGASGLRAMAYLYNTAPKDGSEIGIVYNTNLTERLFGNTKAQYDAVKMTWVGSMGKLQNICVTWHTSPVKTFEQLRKEKQFTVAATGVTGNSAQMPHLFNALLGMDIKVIAGYSTSGQRLALERGEVQGICGLGYSTLVASNPDWFTKKRINILIQVGLEKTVAMADVPMVSDFIKDPRNRQVMDLIMLRQEWGRPVGGPPGIPADRTAALRAAFDATLKDPQFLAEAKRVKLELEPITGRQMDQLLARAHAYPKDIVDATARLVAGKVNFEDCESFAKDSKQCAKKKAKKK